MKRQKSKVFDRRKELVATAINNIKQRFYRQRKKAEEEKVKDEAWVQENRLVLEIHARANNA